MEYTDEQASIIQSEGDMKISALAGSGKTTTLLSYAKERPQNSFLYIAFNRSVKEEAIAKFRKNDVHNTRIETAHSLAFGSVVRNYQYQVKDYKVGDIDEIINSYIPKSVANNQLDRLIFCNYVLKLISTFCNSNEQNTLTITPNNLTQGGDATHFIEKHFNDILLASRNVLALMNKGQIGVTHDFYLKKYQLTNPNLNRYDYIFFDEGQDASAAMLDIFIKQKAKKIIVGDTHQQIYNWRGAVNSLEKIENFDEYLLSTSFRFGQNIANLAYSVLSWKYQIGHHAPIPHIKGLGHESKVTKSKATLARTNINLLGKAIAYIARNKNSSVYFEGNISSYTYADNGSSIYDILNLFLGNRGKIKDSMIRKMESFSQLETYVELVEDGQMRTMINIVREYQEDLPFLIEELKKRHSENKEMASMIFSTMHKAKGMEYDQVELADDFIHEETIIQAEKKLMEKKEVNIHKIIEEINLLYVAITRAKVKLLIPKILFKNQTYSSNIAFI